MRILVHEFVTGGGLVGQKVPPSLAREGASMLAALIADLAAIGEHRITATVERRFPVTAPVDVELVTIEHARQLDTLIRAADAVWVIAPETNGWLERLTAAVHQRGKVLLGSSPSAIHLAADKAALARHLVRHGMPHPITRLIRADSDWLAAVSQIGYPVVIKPVRGAGCHNVYLARDPRQLGSVVKRVRESAPNRPLVLQRYVNGTAASVSLLADGRRSAVLAVNEQSIGGLHRLCYGGGRTPLDHQLAWLAACRAVSVCDVIPGLRGFVGVDLVLTDSEAVVIEVNPRLTTAYLGVRSAIDDNVAELAIAACSGTLPAVSRPTREVTFDTSGRIVSSRPLLARAG